MRRCTHIYTYVYMCICIDIYIIYLYVCLCIYIDIYPHSPESSDCPDSTVCAKSTHTVESGLFEEPAQPEVC